MCEAHASWLGHAMYSALPEREALPVQAAAGGRRSWWKTEDAGDTPWVGRWQFCLLNSVPSAVGGCANKLRILMSWGRSTHPYP